MPYALSERSESKGAKASDAARLRSWRASLPIRGFACTRLRHASSSNHSPRGSHTRLDDRIKFSSCFRLGAIAGGIPLAVGMV